MPPDQRISITPAAFRSSFGTDFTDRFFDERDGGLARIVWDDAYEIMRYNHQNFRCRYSSNPDIRATERFAAGCRIMNRSRS